MRASETRNSLTNRMDMSHARNFRRAPPPISSDPRLNPNDAQGYEHERILDNLHALAADIPRKADDMSSANYDEVYENARTKCCCGRPGCAYLENNHAALGGLEKDLETAARLGQALLSRHESFISESQAEQARLSTCISELESERSALQNANEKIVAENRDLLQQLEHLNGSLVESDQDVKRLENLLLDCESEVKRLNGLVRRTEELDSRVQEMERERHSLSKQIEEDRDENRSTLARWHKSERKVQELEEDLRRIEWEARLDRERHQHIIARLDKERALEKELGGAEGRLKGAAAVHSMSQNSAASKNVVSHFVKDILHDNAILQAGIAELRQLLQTSNEEVQNLREQVMLHQPIHEQVEENQPQQSLSLDQELQSDRASLKQLQQEVHVHHHYHAKLAKPRITTQRRPSKRKAVMPGQVNLSDLSVPSTPMSRPQRYNSSPVVPLNLYHPQPQQNRWSMQSTATMSSVLSSIPSSPRSYFDRGGSIFDRLEQGEESSRPTSPESVGDALSPGLGQWRFKQNRVNLDAFEEEEDQRESFNMSPLVESKPTFDANELPTPSDSEPLQVDKELTPKPSIMLQPQNVEVNGSIHAVLEPRPPDREPTSLLNTPLTYSPPRAVLDDIPEIRPSLTRKGSHETLVSISGMDIHIPQRTSQTAMLELLHSHFAHSPSQARKVSTAQPLASITEYTAISTPASVSREPRKTLRHMPSSIEVLSGIAIPKPRAAKSPSQTGAIGRIGGWVRGKWGIAPTKSTGNLRSVSLGQDPVQTPSSALSEIDTNQEGIGSDTASGSMDLAPNNPRSITMPEDNPEDPLCAKIDLTTLFAGRSPGVNQPGSIPGFRAALMSRRTPSQVMASVIDEEGLKDGLAE